MLVKTSEHNVSSKSELDPWQIILGHLFELDSYDIPQIIEKTGMVPSIHDNGTHYVTNHRLTIELLEEFSKSDDVVEITGDYTGGLTGVGASHSRSDR